MYDQAQEELEYEFNARFDYVREAYGDMQEDPRTLQYEEEACHAEWLAEQEAFIGPRQPRTFGDLDGDIPF